jgi:hypothetical protein
MKIWKKIKLLRKIVLRFSNDIISGECLKFAKRRDQELRFEHSISMSQEIKKNETYESKMFNFSLAAKKVNEVVIYPNEIFSCNINSNFHRQSSHSSVLCLHRLFSDSRSRQPWVRCWQHGNGRDAP